MKLKRYNLVRDLLIFSVPQIVILKLIGVKFGFYHLDTRFWIFMILLMGFMVIMIEVFKDKLVDQEGDYVPI